MSLLATALCEHRGKLEAFEAYRTSPTLDPLSLKFVVHSRTARGRQLDAGCGDGLAAAAVIERGGYVVALDPEPAFIEAVRGRIHAEAQSRLILRAATVQEAEFAEGTFGSIHAARLFNLLTGDEIEQALDKFFRWLKPESKLFISALSPTGDIWRPFLPEFYRRKASAVHWPGIIEDVSDVCGPQPLRKGGFTHLLDEATLRRELTNACFEIEESSSFTLPWDEHQACCAVVARRPH